MSTPDRITLAAQFIAAEVAHGGMPDPRHFDDYAVDALALADALLATDGTPTNNRTNVRAVTKYRVARVKDGHETYLSDPMTKERAEATKRLYAREMPGDTELRVVHTVVMEPMT